MIFPRSLIPWLPRLRLPFLLAMLGLLSVAGQVIAQQTHDRRERPRIEKSQKLVQMVNVSDANAGGVAYRLYSIKLSRIGATKKLLLLGTPNGSLAPNSITLLDRTARKLVARGDFHVAIVGHSAREGGDWNTEGDKLIADYRRVYDHLKLSHPSINPRNTAVGGISFAGFQLGGRAAWDGWVTSLGGVVQIAAGVDSSWSVPNLKIPVVNRICQGDTTANGGGNIAGNGLMQALPAAIKARSDAKTDPACNGHRSRPEWDTELANAIARFF